MPFSSGLLHSFRPRQLASFSSGLLHSLVQGPGRQFTGLTEDEAEFPPAQVYSASTGDVIITAPARQYGGTSSAITVLPPAQVYSGNVGDVVPPIVSAFGFGGTTGGEVIFTILPAPLNLTATVVDAGDVDLVWIDASSGGADGFRVERSLTGQNTWEEIGETEPTETSFRDRFAIPLVTYDYRVFAFDSVGDSLPSNIAMATTPLPPNISTPPPPTTPADPQRNKLKPSEVEFLSPGVYGLEEDDEGNITGNKL